ncbi:retinol dehydrogenase 12-like isoform X1 [Uranotaenia lowii]|uniref:retinol dehydrogenase 12-like isoform X1 n=1 Tax=Uranotaenia lowii TaxID=190385 RepID=UPI0024792643|nr:retinol dehydrogenase 12-like isoform X1 [Uranotaenia lowii]XP_055609933.1 retinol dehydrogenase 12-like isoform X1 [Uranotaenia lowii]
MRKMSSIPSEILLPVGLLSSSVFALRRYKIRKWGWVTNTYPLKGKLFIITGANTGLGYEATKSLTARQATTIMACRNLSKANEAISRIRQETRNGELIPMELDLSSFDSIKKFASEIKTKYPHFDCLINNAGLATDERQFTKEGFEIHFGVNHLGQFLLVDLLKENLKHNNSRVVVVSSRMHEIDATVDIENLGKWVKYNSPLNRLYNNSKLMNFYYARELYKRGFNVHVLCPGLCHTDFFRNYDPKWYHYLLFSPIVWLLLRSAEQGAQNIIHCATDSVTSELQNPVNGYFISNVRVRKSKFPFDEDISRRLWDESVRAIEEVKARS